MSDGIEEWTQHEFRPDVARTAEDQAIYDRDEIIFGDDPKYRILRMQAFLEALAPVQNEYISAHVKAIREIHKTLSRFIKASPGIDEWTEMSEADRAAHNQRAPTEEELRLLDEADRLRTAIAAIPDADLGRSFRKGRKVGTVKPIRKAIRALLRRRDMDNHRLWDAISSKPPKGYRLDDSSVFYEDRRIVGPTKGDDMTYASFCKAASTERGLLKK